MSPLWLTLILEGAFAISIGSLSGSSPAVPAYVAGLEKAAQEQVEKYEQKVEKIVAEESTQAAGAGEAAQDGTAASPEVAAPSATAAEAKRQSKKVSMHDMPHYRNHGAAFAHVDAKESKKASTRTPEQTAKAKELAEKRAEVEEIFHLSHQGGVERYATPAAPAEKPVGIGRQLMRFGFSMAAVLTIAGIGYHKYEVIRQMAEGKTGLAKPKAKTDYMDDFGSKFA